MIHLTNCKLFVGISQVHNIQDLYGDKYHPPPNNRLLETVPIEATVSNVYRNAPKPLQKRNGELPKIPDAQQYLRKTPK
jgi:hypothetical protein